MIFEEMKAILSSAAKEAGIEQFDIYYSASNSASAETLKDEISAFNSENSMGICFRCIVDGKFGQAACENFTEDELRSLVAKAADNARYIESDDESILFAGSPSYREVKNELLPMPTAAELCDRALKLQGQTYAESEYVADGTQSQVGASQLSVDMYNSYGLSLHKDASAYQSLVVAVVNKDGNAEDEYDYVYGNSFDGADALSGKTVEKALSKLGAEPLESGTYDVVISGKQMSVLLNVFSGIFSAKNVRLGLSLLKGKEGEKIASDIITLVDDPFSSRLIAKTPFDAEGVATATKTVIENGVLKSFLYDLANAKAMGKETTANAAKGGYASPVVIAPYYFGIEAGDTSFEDMLKKVGNGVYVTALKGLHAGANPVTGDFSIESAGYRIVDGKLGAAVKSFTIAGNFYELLKNVSMLSSEITVGVPGTFSAYGAPDALLEKVSIAGK